jgi:DnaJ homolog subfamily C member 7
LELDTLNNEYNKAILFNMACGLSKVDRCAEALSSLNQAIAMDKEYAKAYIKRGDILLQQELYDESIAEYMKVKEFAPSTPGLREKVQAAQLELKKSKRKDYYKILSVDKGAGASMIKTAYRKMAVKWHPDKHGNADEKTQAEAEVMFKEIGEAYAVLSDAKKKEMYDQGMDLEEIEQGGQRGHGGFSQADMFSQFTGGGMGGGMHFSFH